MITVEHPLITAAPSARVPRVSMLRILLVETRMECLRLLRTPSFSVPTILFPLMFYLLFGVLLRPANPDPAMSRTILANFLVFGVMGPGLFGLGVTLAMDRDRGLLELKRAMPMPPGIYLAAKLIMAMVFAAIVAAVLIITSALLGRLMLEVIRWCALFVLSVVGVLPFCGLGLLVGTFTKGQSAAAITNLIYIPMSFLSGLWVPLSFLPKVVSQVALLWPSYHLAGVAQAIVSGQAAGVARHLLILLGVTVLFFVVARRRLPDLR
jgi:ABC-2 type transport system permease protein